MSNSVWEWHGVDRPLRFTQQPLVSPAANQVQVANRLIPINPVDWKLCSSGHPSWSYGHAPGVDGVGVISAVGENVSSYWLGKRVAYHGDLTRNGSFARFTNVDADRLILLPERLSDEQAGWLPCPGLTAAQIIAKIPSLPGRKALVCGAAGAVGMFAAQLLVQQGAEVYVTASQHNHRQLISFGVAGAVDYRQPDWLARLNDMVPSGFDAAVDLVGTANAESLYPLLAYESHLVSVLGRIAPQGEPFAKCVSVHEVALGASYQYANAHQKSLLVQAGEDLAEQLVQGRIVLNEPSVVNFEQLGDCLMDLGQGTIRGKWMAKIT